jgi:hypothetical protein
MLPILACGVGIYLGLYFNILVLIPVSMLAVGAFIMSDHGAAVVLFPLIYVQAGYMLGLTGREVYGQLLGRLNIALSKRI